MSTDEWMKYFFQYIDGKISLDKLPEAHPTPDDILHGPCIRVIQEAYGDRLIYQDGYEEFRSIGD